MDTNTNHRRCFSPTDDVKDDMFFRLFYEKDVDKSAFVRYIGI